MAQNTTADKKTVEKDGIEYKFEYNEVFGVWEYSGEMDVSEVPLDVFYAFRDAGLPTAQFKGAREKVAERFSEMYSGHVTFKIGARDHFDVGDEWRVCEETAVTYRGVEAPIVSFQKVA